jgi:hypothetical protein
LQLQIGLCEANSCRCVHARQIFTISNLPSVTSRPG